VWAAVSLRFGQPVEPVFRPDFGRSGEPPCGMGHPGDARRTAPPGHRAHRRPRVDAGALRQPHPTRALHRRGGLADRTSRRWAVPGDTFPPRAQALPAAGDHDAEPRAVRAGSLGQRRGSQCRHQSTQNTRCDQRGGGGRTLPLNSQRAAAPAHLRQSRGAGAGRGQARDHLHPGQPARRCADHDQSRRGCRAGP